jgi:hypothetical protein
MAILHYKFYLNQIGVPQFDVDFPFEGLSELGSCRNVDEIVNSLKQLIASKIDEFSFGYEVYLIECNQNICKVVNTFDNWTKEADVPTAEFLSLMEAWQQYISNL